MMNAMIVAMAMFQICFTTVVSQGTPELDGAAAGVGAGTGAVAADAGEIGRAHV